MKIGSMAFKIIDVGFEKNVQAYKTSWKDGKDKKYLSIEPLGVYDTQLAYADVVIMSASDQAGYLSTLTWYAGNIGLSKADCRKSKPQGKLPLIKYMRIYWYHEGTNGYLHSNIGFGELLERHKLNATTKEKLMAAGNASAEGAYAILLNLMEFGKHFACRPVIAHDNKLQRSIISSLAVGEVHRWEPEAAGNRCPHKWQEELHGVVVEKFLEHRRMVNTHDSSTDFMDALVTTEMEARLPVKLTGSDQEPRKEGVRLIMRGPVRVYITPDGAEYDMTSKGYVEVLKRYLAEQEALKSGKESDETQPEEEEP